MRDAQDILHAKGLAPLNVERTEPKHGELYEVRGRYVRMGDPLPIVVVPTDTDDNPDRDNAWGLTLAVFGLGIGLALITIGLLGMAGVFG